MEIHCDLIKQIFERMKISINKPFKKFLLSILIFIIFLIFVDYIFGLVFSNLLNKQLDGRFFKISYSLDKSNEDIIIIGSSRAETNYNPAIFNQKLGMSCWNSGRGGQGIPYFNIIVHETLKRYSPKIIILNMDPTGLEGSIDYDRASILKPFIKNHESIYEFLKDKNCFEKYKLMSNIYLYNSMMFYFIRPYLMKNVDGRSSERGWKPLEGTISESIIAHGQNINVGSYLNKTKTEYLNQIIKEANNKNVKLIIAISPNYLPQLQETETIKFLKKLETQKKIKLFDFTQDKLFVKNNDFFHDLDHMNKIGANEYSKTMSDYIKSSRNDSN